MNAHLQESGRGSEAVKPPRCFPEEKTADTSEFDLLMKTMILYCCMHLNLYFRAARVDIERKRA